MDPISSFMKRRQGMATTVQYNRDLNSSMRRSGRIGGVRNVAMDASGRRVAMPTSAQIGAGTAPRSFYRSMALTRADNVRAAMLDGTFGSKRAKFNAGNKTSQMDELGNIRPTNPFTDGGQLPTSSSTAGTTTPPAGSTAPKPAAPPAPAASPAPTTAGGRVMQGLGLGGSQTGPKVPFAPKPARQPSKIVDETGDITERIQKSLLHKSQASRAVAAPAAAPADDLVQRASALAAASKGINEATKKGFLRTKRIPGQGGEPPKVQVNAPVMRESGERVTMPKFFRSQRN